MKILYVHATFVPPPTDVRLDRFFRLSELLEGDVLQPIWLRSAEEVEANFGPGSFPVHRVGRFRYHWFFAWRHKGTIRNRLAAFWFYLTKGLDLCRKHRYDCIVAYSHMTTGIVAGLLKLLTRGKLIIEIATSPQFAYLTDRPRPTRWDRVMHWYSDGCLHLSMAINNRAHFLYPGQLSAYPLLRKTPNSVFHEFVPVSTIDRYRGQAQTDPFILLVGAPWYLKGTDLLIDAFKRVAPDFPSVKLKILGYYPDRAEMDVLIGDAPRIEILAARPNPETIEIISQAAILVLPSRCEGMGRVLIEAMAAGVPILGSDVGGIPFMIREGENGCLFSGGDSFALERRLREMLADPALRKKMGDNGYQQAHLQLNEKVYVEQFARMVSDAVNGNK
jgi:glycosyltransferase involved in cell wall biosynthesis